MNDSDPTLYHKAIDQLAEMLESARGSSGAESASAALATCGTDARPSVRTVDIVRVTRSGIVFFANRSSGKAQQMRDNPRAGLCFHWPSLKQQVTVDGDVAMLPDAEADAAWNHRPRDYGLSHWASDQAAVAETETGLRAKLDALKQQYSFSRVPRAPDWCAYELRPDRIEFWKSGWNRLKSRVRFVRTADGNWLEERANP
jgi:pyridoxamine 5'-phosphate oxidase